MGPSPNGCSGTPTTLYQWRGRSMGRTIMRAYKGALLLTSHRLAFFSTGDTDVWRKMAWGRLGLGPPPLANAAVVSNVVSIVTGVIAKWFTTAEGTDESRIGPVELSTDGDPDHVALCRRSLFSDAVPA